MAHDSDQPVRRRGCCMAVILLPFTAIAIVWPLAFYWYGGTLGDIRGFLRNHGMNVGAATGVTLIVVLIFHHQVKARWERFRYRDRD